jgi:hypothetical protein
LKMGWRPLSRYWTTCRWTQDVPSSDAKILLQFVRVHPEDGTDKCGITICVNRVRMLRAGVKTKINRIRVWGEVRSDSLFCFRKRTQAWAIFSVSHESLNWPLLVTGIITGVLGFVVSFTTYKSKGCFPQTFPFATMKTFGVGDDLSYSLHMWGDCIG